jgi:outer membrane immunogenic protein
MTYLTGGYAVGNVKASSQIFSAASGYQSFASGSATLHGWTIGGGLEYALRPHFTVKGEYLYAHLGRFTTTSTAALAESSGFFEERHYHIREDAIRFGINYRL